MTRLTPLLAASVFAAALPAAAEAAPLRAEFAAPFERATEVIVDGRMWSCAGNACTSQRDDPRPAIACRKLARKVGPVTRFGTPLSELDAAALASCNQDHQ
jgi:hypothetical protein